MSVSVPSIDVMMSQLDAYMRTVVQEELSGKIQHMTEYHIGWVDAEFRAVRHANMGKRVRPMLTLLIFLLFQDRLERVYPVATAIEFVHNFSLIFDDIQDKDTLRRERRAVWSLWGEDEAINVGCALQTLASLALSNMTDYFPKSTVHETQKFLNRIMLRLCHGQQMDLLMTKQKELINLEQYLAMISGKTAALFEGATYLGALCADATPTSRELCREFGHLLGMCFQFFDDAVGVWGLKERGLDKPRLDLEKRKKTYPIIYTYSALPDAEKRRLLSIYHADAILDDDSLWTIRRMLDKTHALQKTVQEGREYLELAIGMLNAVAGIPTIKQLIIDWIHFVTNKQLESLQDEVGFLW